MKLLRLATIYLNPTPRTFRSWSIKFGEVEVETKGTYEIEGETRLLVVAKVDVDADLELTNDGYLVIPGKERIRAEVAIEAAANLVAVVERCKRRISSPTPCIALLPDNKKMFEWLQNTKGMKLQICSVTNMRSFVPVNDAFNFLGDRLDGVALLAEGLSQDHSVGRFHEFVRLFERAFRLSPAKLIKPLTNFLVGANQGYTKTEIQKWLSELRHPATHADKREEFVLERDVRPVIRRIEQAAYDVLFNKAEWRSVSIKRREVWLPSAKTVSANPPNLEVKEGSECVLESQLLDPFGSYPLDLSSCLSELPEGWWSKNGS